MMKPIRSSTSALLVLPFLAVIGLTACDTGAQNPPPREGSSADAGAQARPLSAEANSGDSYEVIIGSGPFAGTHRGTDELNCMIDEGTWSATFDEERDRGVSALSVTLGGIPETGGSTEDVTLLVIFGQPGATGGDAGGVGIAGPGIGGAGRATAEREGRDAVMRIEGTTGYGAAISAVIRCRSVE